jgi:DNA-directed RNA polymerase specialized sigma subunit
MRLTDEQRALAEEHLFLLHYFKVGRLQDKDEMQSVVGMALCHAAFYYRENCGTTFKTFAIRRIKQFLWTYFRTASFGVGGWSVERIPIGSDSGIPETGQTCDVAAAIDAADNKEKLVVATRKLPPEQRLVTEALLSGQEIREIAKATGRTRACVSMNRTKAIGNLRRMLA